MDFTFTVTATVDRVEGKFASRDEIEGELREALDSANPGEVSGVGADAMSTYEVTDWEVAS